MANNATPLLANAPLVNGSGVVTPQGLAFLSNVAKSVRSTSVGSAQKVSLANGLNIYVGSGDPNGQITDSPPAVYFNTAGGASTTLYVKESGANTDTGWVGK